MEFSVIKSVGNARRGIWNINKLNQPALSPPKLNGHSHTNGNGHSHTNGNGLVPPPEKKSKTEGSGDEEIDLSPYTNSYQTPVCFQYTIMGSIPHLTWELAEAHIKHHSPLLVPFQDLFAAQDAIGKIAPPQQLESFFCIPKNKNYHIFTSVIDPAQPARPGWNKRKEISLWTSGGRKSVTLDQFKKTIETTHPDLVHCMADCDTSRESLNKRFINSHESSQNWLNAYLASGPKGLPPSQPTFASITGGYNLTERSKCIKFLRENQSVSGYVFEGLVIKELDKMTEENETVSGTDLIRQTCQLLPAAAPRLFFGPLHPITVWKLIQLGIDGFDSSFCTQLADAGKVLLCSELDQLICESSRCEGLLNPINPDYGILDLKEKKFADNMSPIDASCACHTCEAGYTGAYINHLLNCKEMLAYVLLNIHNLHSYYTLIHYMRAKIEESDQLNN